MTFIITDEHGQTRTKDTERNVYSLVSLAGSFDDVVTELSADEAADLAVS